MCRLATWAGDFALGPANVSRALREQIEEVEHHLATMSETVAAEEAAFVAARDQLLAALTPLRGQAESAARLLRHADVRCREADLRLVTLTQQRVGDFSRRHNVMGSPAVWLTLPLFCFGWLPLVAFAKIFGGPWEAGVAALGVAGLATGALLGRYIGRPQVGSGSGRHSRSAPHGGSSR